MTSVGSWLSTMAMVAPMLLASACSDDGEDATLDGDGALPDKSSLDGAVVSDGGLDASPPAPTYYWTDWHTLRYGGDGGVDGVLTLPTGELAVTYNGAFYGAQVDGGPDFWKPESPYLSSTVGNGPPGTDIVKIEGGNAVPMVLSFGVPVTDPVIAFCSLGSLEKMATNEFEQAFELLSSAPGAYGNTPLRQEPGNKLTGQESYGVIRFPGTHTTLRWTAPVGERWHGFTVGLAAQVRADAGLTP